VNLCPTCKTSFSHGEQFCPRDGTPLQKSLPEDPLAGRVLSGRYRLIEVIGRGGMGAVYRAHHILMDKGVAVKVLRQELASDTEAVARFHREARSASRLDHENIIRVSDFGQTDDGLLFLVMELLDGENLAQALRRGPLPWRRAATVARAVALGLGHAHEQGVIHRDLKPENIVLVRRGNKSRQGMFVKVLDFGLAKLVHLKPPGEGEGPTDGTAAEAGEGEPDVAIQSLTRAGVVFGTPEYMSPEQAEGRSLDARTDIYALGVVCYQMLTGKLPFTAPTFLALIAKTVNEPPPPLRSVIADAALELPLELEELVLHCLAKSPAERPQTAEDFADSLSQLLSQYPEEPMRSGEVATVTPLSPPSGRPAGGVARTVQRHLPPGQTPLLAPRTDLLERPGESAPSPAVVNEQAPEAPRVAIATRESPVPSEPEALLAKPAAPTDAPEAARLRALAKAQADDKLAEPDALGAADLDGSLTVPRRPYWLAALGVVALIAASVYWVKPRLHLFGPMPRLSQAEREPLRRARELLSAESPPAAQVEEALRILRDEREVRNTPEVHRLLSRAYEAQSNRLRALGHLYTAVRLGDAAGGGREAARSELALSQLLSRLGHPQDACQAAARLLAARTVEADVRRQALALLSTLRCPRN